MIYVIQKFLVIIVLLLIISCNRPSEGSYNHGKRIQNTVTAIAETHPVAQNKNADAADDPAIWIHPGNKEKSVIIGTDKKGGLVTYNLDGDLLNYYAHGNMNNCDLRYGFTLKNDTIDILASSNRTLHSISIYKISDNGVLDSVHSRIITSEMIDEVYGLCIYKSPKTGKYFVFINSKAGEVEQWELFENGSTINAKLVRAFDLKKQTEGMVADDETGIIYIGKEEAGIYKFDAEPDGNTEGVLVANSTESNKNIKFDIEGLTIYKTGKNRGFLIASSQGNYSYAVFELQNSNKYIGSFRIIDGEIDGVEETDGIDVTNVALGDKYPKGVLVVQDGYNYEGKKLKSQNFKLISWSDIEKLLVKEFK